MLISLKFINKLKKNNNKKKSILKILVKLKQNLLKKMQKKIKYLFNLF